MHCKHITKDIKSIFSVLIYVYRNERRYKMKKSFIFASVFVGILMVSLVSAGWWSDLFNSPPSVTGNVINTRGIDLDLNKLSEGVQLSKGWNYWFIWKDSEMPVAQLVSGLDANSYRYVYEYNPQTRKTAYWYGDSNSKNQFDKFVSGNWYAIYMLSSANWQYSSEGLEDPEYDLVLSGLVNVEGSLFINHELHVSGGIQNAGHIEGSGLTLHAEGVGEGIGFACFLPNGELFRSPVACDEFVP